MAKYFWWHLQRPICCQTLNTSFAFDKISKTFPHPVDWLITVITCIHCPETDEAKSNYDFNSINCNLINWLLMCSTFTLTARWKAVGKDSMSASCFKLKLLEKSQSLFLQRGQKCLGLKWRGAQMAEIFVKVILKRSYNSSYLSNP